MIGIEINGDSPIEGNETFHVTLSNATSTAGPLTIVQPVSTVTIVEDDLPSVGLPLVTGLNLIGPPADLASPVMASDVAEQIGAQGGNVAQVVRWDADSQSYVLWSSASPSANDFELQAGFGYFVLVAAAPVDGTWAFLGSPFTNTVPITSVTGLNLVSFPFMTRVEGYDAGSLAQAFQDQGGQVAQVVRWDSDGQVFGIWSAASPQANAYDVDSTSGYFVLVTQPTALSRAD